ncbi:GNAT family N-acetyltransferase [Oxalobacteraceae bacterium R-40]|uniref:GNAT family N-acetyltransferase n=1 Tax=Keguizhuia sedimenti TaxID=3064264 RepID=A0ABU1BMZ1_9BURK|nr:GNAT family N-acetyltransferase [Oxalobacteraceae bacterium R-40]
MAKRESKATADDACQRFHLMGNDRIKGFIEYYPFERFVIVTHTEVLPELEGKGNGSELARRAVAFFQEEGKQVVPVCGFFAQFLRKHPEYIDVVTPESRRIFNI